VTVPMVLFPSMSQFFLRTSRHFPSPPSSTGVPLRGTEALDLTFTWFPSKLLTPVDQLLPASLFRRFPLQRERRLLLSSSLYRISSPERRLSPPFFSAFFGRAARLRTRSLQPIDLCKMMHPVYSPIEPSFVRPITPPPKVGKLILYTSSQV